MRFAHFLHNIIFFARRSHASTRREREKPLRIRHALIAAWLATLQLQIRGNHEPHAFKTLTGGLAGGRISSVGIEGMAVVFDLVAVCGRISAQLAGKRTWTRGDS